MANPLPLDWWRLSWTAPYFESLLLLLSITVHVLGSFKLLFPNYSQITEIANANACHNRLAKEKFCIVISYKESISEKNPEKYLGRIFTGFQNFGFFFKIILSKNLLGKGDAHNTMSRFLIYLYINCATSCRHKMDLY